MAMSLVDTDRYPIHDLDSPAGRALVERCQRDLRERALCALPGYLRPEGLRKLVDEANGLMPNAVFTDNMRKVNFQVETDEVLPADHPRNVTYANRYARLVNYLFPNQGYSRALFLWSRQIDFVRQVYGAETMFPTQCPHLGLTMKVEGEGDTDGWHYDGNDGVITLLLQKPDEGGYFEYAPYIRTLEDERFDEVAKVLRDPVTYAQRPEAEPGTFVFFNGNLSLHRVAPVGRTTKPRMVLIFSYDRTPNYVFGDRVAERFAAMPKVKDVAALRTRYLSQA
ncbi:MAG: hypothetical protein RIC83_04890 [Alphaproteobacteria bacterium]